LKESIASAEDGNCVVNSVPPSDSCSTLSTFVVINDQMQVSYVKTWTNKSFCLSPIATASSGSVNPG
ncbi:hypothetical protein HDU99_005729, partial [Rhizoclosmatium hyalinum]